MQVASELEELLQDRFDVTTTDFIAGLRLLPANRAWATSLTKDEASLLDAADFSDKCDAFVAVGIETAGRTARLMATAFTPQDVATGLGVSVSRVRQKRLNGELWAIPSGQSWLFPALQFEPEDQGGPHRQIRGLDRVFKALPAGLHPVALARFLHTPHPDLFHGRAMTPVDWLREGEDTDQAVAAAASIDVLTA